MKTVFRFMTPRRQAVLAGLLAPACVWTVLCLRNSGPEKEGPVHKPAVSGAAPAAAVPARSLSRESETILAATKPPRADAPWHDPATALALLPMLEKIPLGEIQAACESLLPTEPHSDTNALKLLVEYWITLTPADAFRWVMAQTVKSSSDKTVWKYDWNPMLQACGRMWAAQDAPGFLHWWQRTGSRLSEASAPFTGFTLREEITWCMAGWLAQEWPSEALRYFASTPDIRGKDGSGRNISLGIDAGNLIHTREAARDALRLMEQCRETNEGAHTISMQVMKKWAALDESDFGHWLSAHPDYSFSANGQEILARHRLEHSPDRAAAANAWLADRGHASESETMIQIVTTWPEGDLDSAGRWLNALPRNPRRWSAVEKFAERALAQDPEAAFAWLATVEDPAQRRARIARVFDEWERVRPDQAAAFLQEHPFDEAQMQWIEERRAVR